jgi:hypothetical protein
MSLNEKQNCFTHAYIACGEDQAHVGSVAL